MENCVLLRATKESRWGGIGAELMKVYGGWDILNSLSRRDKTEKSIMNDLCPVLVGLKNQTRH